MKTLGIILIGTGLVLLLLSGVVRKSAVPSEDAYDDTDFMKLIGMFLKFLKTVSFVMAAAGIIFIILDMTIL